MVEAALVMPLFIMVLFGIIVLGIGVFYQQQITNAAREAARFAAIHSATARCPTTGTLDPASPPTSYPVVTVPGGCDRKAAGWPFMTPHARNAVFGLNRSAVKLSACWSGYRKNTATGAIDAPPRVALYQASSCSATSTAWIRRQTRRESDVKTRYLPLIRRAAGVSRSALRSRTPLQPMPAMSGARLLPAFC